MSFSSARLNEKVHGNEDGERGGIWKLKKLDILQSFFGRFV
jgi:hypothetical protein